MRGKNTEAVQFNLLIIFVVVFVNFSIQQGTNRIGDTYVDFPTFYYATELVFEDGISPYPPANWRQTENMAGKSLWPYLYPPPSLVILGPLSLLSYETAKTMILVINHLLTMLIGYLFTKKFLNPDNRTYILGGLIYLYSFYPITSTISHGQINLIVLVLIMSFWYFIKFDYHPALSAISLVLAILLKVYPLLFIPYLILKRKHLILIWVVISLAISSAIGSAFLPAGIWGDWYHYVLQTGYGETLQKAVLPGSVLNQSINGFTSRLFIGRNLRIDVLISNPDAATRFPYIFSAIILIATFSLITISHFRRDLLKGSVLPVMDLDISLILVTMYLVAPFSWDHHLVFLLPALFISLETFSKLRHRTIWLGPLAIVGVILALNYPFNHPIFRTGIYTLLISVKFYAVTLLWLIISAFISANQFKSLGKKWLSQ